MAMAGRPSNMVPKSTRGNVAGCGAAIGLMLAAQLLMVLASSVTAPLRAKALPSVIVAPVSIVMLVYARICPSNAVVVPSVAELPTCQNILQPGVAEPALIVTTEELVAVVSVVPIWKINCAAELPWSLRVSVPVSPAEDENE